MSPLVRTRWGARGDAERLSLVHGIAPCTTNDAFLPVVIPCHREFAHANRQQQPFATASMLSRK